MKSEPIRDMQDIESCPSCKSSQLKILGNAISIDPTQRFYTAIVACSACNHWHSNPIPTQEYLNKLYSESSRLVLGEGQAEIYSKGSKELVNKNPRNWVLERARFLKVGVFLEIGTGDGSLFQGMRELGWQCYGVDPGGYLKEPSIVTDRVYLPKDLKADVVALQDVLEHVADPWQELKKYGALMSPNAQIFMNFPWSESLEARKMGSDWSMVRPLGHLHYFSKASASSLLQTIDCEMSDILITNLTPSKIVQCKSFIWLLSTLPLQFLRRNVRSNPYKQRWYLLKQTFVSLFTDGDQLYVMGTRAPKKIT